MRISMIIAVIASSLYSVAADAAKAREEFVDGNVWVTRAKVHPRYVTVLYLPGKVTSVVNSAPAKYETGLDGKQVFVRPHDGKAGEANLAITSRGLKLTVIVEVAESPDDADSQLVLKRRPKLGQEPVAWQMHNIVGGIRAGDPTAGDRTDIALVAGVAAHMRIRGSAIHAYEVNLALVQSEALRFDRMPIGEYQGDMLRLNTMARLMVGMNLHYGRRWVPFLRAAVGGQARALAASRYLVYPTNTVIDGPEKRLFWDALVGAGVGLDVHINHDWTVGIGAQWHRAVRTDGPYFESMEGVIHVSW